MKILVLLGMVGTLVACGGGGGGSSTASQATPVINNNIPEYLYAYDKSSRYSSIIEDCVLAETRLDACYLSDLPLIGQHKTTISRADVAERLVISHDWMGERFMALLDELPDEIVQMFGALSAVVIAYDIRPSYYWRLTNTIYLDPADLWLTNEEKATIAVDPDYRSGFGNSLQFISTWDYMDGRYLAWDYYPLDGTEERTLQDIIAPNAQLILHELSHANDVFPPALWSSIDHSKKPDLAAQDIINDWASTRLDAFYPLRSDLLYRVADVLFYGEDPDEEILDLSASTLGIEFSSDSANDDYNYASIREDVAMLFEEAMMWHLFSMDRVNAYLDVPSVDDPICDDYLTGWGQRARISQPSLAPRLRMVIEHILPSANVDEIIDGLPTTIEFTQGISYCDNIIASSDQRDLISPVVPKFDRAINKKLSPTIFKKGLRLESSY